MTLDTKVIETSPYISVGQTFSIQGALKNFLNFRGAPQSSLFEDDFLLNQEYLEELVKIKKW